MKKLLLQTCLVALIPAFLSGCANNATYIQTGGGQSIVTVGDVNIQDYIDAAEKMSASLLASGVLDKVPSPPAIIAISRVENRTTQHLETELLTKKIRIALSKGGKAITRMNFGVGADGKPLMEDPSGAGIEDEKNFRNDVKLTRLPDFTLSGKIIETTVKAGRTRQSTYSFQMSLGKGNYAVWEDEREITKSGKGKGASVGF